MIPIPLCWEDQISSPAIKIILATGKTPKLNSTNCCSCQPVVFRHVLPSVSTPRPSITRRKVDKLRQWECGTIQTARNIRVVDLTYGRKFNGQSLTIDDILARQMRQCSAERTADSNICDAAISPRAATPVAAEAQRSRGNKSLCKTAPYSHKISLPFLSNRRYSLDGYAYLRINAGKSQSFTNESRSNKVRLNSVRTQRKTAKLSLAGHEGRSNSQFIKISTQIKGPEKTTKACCRILKPLEVSSKFVSSRYKYSSKQISAASNHRSESKRDSDSYGKMSAVLGSNKSSSSNRTTQTIKIPTAARDNTRDNNWRDKDTSSSCSFRSKSRFSNLKSPALEMFGSTIQAMAIANNPNDNFVT